MSGSVTNDMTDGAPFKHIVNFCIPLIGGMLFQQCYNLVDAAIVGRYLGTGALAAVGSTGSVIFMVIGFCMGVCNGFAIPIAQKFGASDYKDMRKYVANSAWLCSTFAVALTILCCLLCKTILQGMNTPESIMEWAYDYLFVIFLGIPTTFLYNMLSGIMRSLGDSKNPLYFLIFSSILNIILDFIFIMGAGFGVSGAAWATITSQAISGVLCFWYIRRKFKILRIQKDERKLSILHIDKLCIMGLPMGLQYSITAIGSVILQRSVNGLGPDYVAGMAAAMKVHPVLGVPLEALGSTIATFAGQNIGARKLERVDEGMKCCLKIGFIYSILAFLVVLVFGKYMVLVFLKKEDVFIRGLATKYLTFMVMFYVLLCIVNVVRFCIQGLGYSLLAILAGVFEMIARTFFGFVVVPKVGFTAACLGSPFAWVLADLFLIPAYFLVRHRLKQVMNS